MKQISDKGVPTADSAHGTVDLAGARRCIEDGRALVVPTPYPLTSFLMSTRPYAARHATGGGPVHLALALEPRSALNVLEPYLHLTGPAWGIAARLLHRGGLTLTLPLRSQRGLPGWILAVARSGRVTVQAIPWPAVQRLLPAREPLFCTEARRRGAAPVSDTTSAILGFPLNVSVLSHRSLYGGAGTTSSATGSRRAPTVVALARNGALSLALSGAHDHGTADKAEFLSDLRTWCSR